ncbi:MAG: flavin reductase family protein [Nitrososphaerales archaeon]|nr:flavin reductase family protein [Nitrososphaerales archaeon]
MRQVDPALVHRLFYPGVPAILSARSGRTVAAMPVISYAQLSEKPPLFGVSCARRSFTLKLAASSKAFALSLLDAKHIRSVELLASRRGKQGSDKLAGAGLTSRKGRKVDAPVISESVAALECSVYSTETLGDHVLLVGKVEAAYASPDFRGYWRFIRYRPMLYAGWRDGMSSYKPS